MRHRTAIRAAARIIMAERPRAALASQLTLHNIRWGTYSKEEVRIAMQPPRRQLEPEDGYLYSYFMELIGCGAVASAAWRLGSCPDTVAWNPMLLAMLQRSAPPLTCTVTQNRPGRGETGDGSAVWTQPVIVGTSHRNDADGTRTRVLTHVPPGQAPLEIGPIDIATTIWHLHHAGAVARWPEHSTEVYLFVRSAWTDPNLRIQGQGVRVAGAMPEDYALWEYYERALVGKPKHEARHSATARMRATRAAN